MCLSWCFTAAAVPSAADTASARTLYESAVALKTQGKPREALEKLKAASSIAPTAIILRELALTHLELRELVEAREAFLAVGRLPIDPRETSRSAEARQDSAKRAEELRAHIPSLTIVVRGVPTETLASVNVDGQDVAKAAIGTARATNPGSHEVSIRAQDGTERRASATLAEGENKEIVVTFEPSSSAASAASASPKMATTSQPTPGPLPSPPAAGSSGHIPWWSWAGFGVAGAGAITGGLTGALVLGKSSSLKDACPGGHCAASERETFDSAHDLATVSNVAFVVAAVGASVGVVGLFVGSGAPTQSTPTTGLRVIPSVGLGSAFINGSF